MKARLKLKRAAKAKRRQKRKGYSPAAATHRVARSYKRLPRPRVLIDHGLRWYVVWSCVKGEQRVERSLKADGYGVYVPRESRETVLRGRIVETEKMAVPRYIFVGVDDGAPIDPVRHLDGVEDVLSDGDRKPVSVPPELLQGFADRLTCHLNGPGGTVEAFSRNQAVRVADGPFSGFLGAVDAVFADDRVRVLVELFGRPTPMDFQLGQVRAA